jgi:hypothetical protein
MMEACANGCHARFGFNPCPTVASTNAAVIAGIGFEWNRVPSPKFVHPGCTVTTNRIQVGEMLLHEGVEAYKKEGSKFMAPGGQTEGQGQRLMTWAGKEVALGIAVTGICLYDPDECRSPGHSSGSGCAGPAIWSDQAPG